MGFFSNFKEGVATVGRFITPLGSSFGAALATPYARKLEEESLQRRLDLFNAIQEQAKRTTDLAKRQKLIDITTRLGDDKGIIGQVKAFQETPLQTFAKAGTTVLSIIGGVSTFGKLTGLGAGSKLLSSKPVVDFIAGSGGVEKVSRLAKLSKYGLIAAKNFGIGAGFGTLYALEEGETDAKTIAKEAALFGATNVILPPIVGKTLGTAGRLISKGSKGAGKLLEKGIQRLELISSEPIKKSTNQLDDFINIAHSSRFSPTFQSLKTKLAEHGVDVGKAIQSLPARFKTIVVDRMNPIRDLSKQATEILNRPVSFTNDPYKQARRTMGLIEGKFSIAAGKSPINREGLEQLIKEGKTTRQQVDELIFLDDIGQSTRKLVNDYKDIDDVASAYVAAKNAGDRIKLGQPVVRGKTSEDVAKAISLAEKNPEFARIQEYEQLFKDINSKTLEIRKQAGLISEKQVKTFEKTHPNYVPNKVLDYFDEGGVSFNKLVTPSSSKLSVAESGITRAKGSEREIMNPLEAVVVDMKKAITDAERNNTATKILNLGSELGEEFGYKALRTAENVTARRDLLSEIKRIGKKNTARRKAIAELKKDEKKLFSNIKDITVKKEALATRDLRLKISAKNKEMEGLFEEASVRASEFENSSLINNLLAKAETRERRLFALGIEMDGIISKINKAKSEKITIKSKEIMQMRAIRREIEKELEARAKGVTAMRQELFNLKDIEVSAIDLAKEGKGKVSRMVNGEREDWIVPADIEIAMKNLDAPEIGFITKMLSIPATILKAGATKYNPGFIFRNPARDIQTAMITSEKGLTPDAWIKMLLQTKNKDKALLDLFNLEGAPISGFFSKKATPKQILKAIDESPTFTENALKANPFKIIESIGDKLEQTTRQGVFKTSIQRGMTPGESAWQARNATIDFTKMGSGMAVFNKVMPFLNARTQGFVNIGKAIAKDPTVFVRRQMWSSIYPTMLLNGYNNQFESYKNIDQTTKDGHWIIMTGEEDGVDESGNPIKIPNAIKIVKGESQQAIANTMDNFLEFVKGNDSRTYQELTGDLLKTISPISGSSALGPITTPFELATNYDLFRKKAIVPDYIRIGAESFEQETLEDRLKSTKYSSETAKRIGEQFNISPARIDFIIGKLFGGLGTDAIKAMDLVQGEGLKARSGAELEDLSNFEKMAQYPVVRGFLTTSTFGAMVKDIELADKTTKFLAGPRVIENQQAEIIWKSLNNMDGDDANNEWDRIKKEDPVMFELIEKIWKDEIKGFTSTDRIIQNLGVTNGERALFIVEQFNMVDDIEMKNAMWDDWVNKKLINKTVSTHIKEIIEKDISVND